ncbi:MAG: glycosyltransferase family 2 protein [Clostridiales bacterium]|nr:glycosyltransferase family 2 protein [Clostridiales bacterium]
MYTYSIFVICDGSAEKLRETAGSLRGLTRGGNVDVTYIFKKIYEIPPYVHEVIEELKSDAACLIGESPGGLNQYIRSRRGRLFFLMNEGDRLESKYFAYCDRFFNRESANCYAASLPECGGVTVVWAEAAKAAGLDGVSVREAFDGLVRRLTAEKNGCEPISRAFPVTCIIPFYNAAAYLDEAIDSLLSQTMDFTENVELILADAGSTDDSEGICESYKEAYPGNVIYIAETCINAAKNAGLDAACGEYAAFLDAEDRFDDNYLESAVKFLHEHPEADFMAFPIECADGARGNEVQGFKTARVVNAESDDDFIQLYIDGVVFRRSAIDEPRFIQEPRGREDIGFIHRLLTQNPLCGASAESRLLSHKRGDTAPVPISSLKLFADQLTDVSVKTLGTVSAYTQRCLLYCLQWPVFEGAVPNEPEDGRLLERTLTEITSQIDDAVIMSACNLTQRRKIYLLSLKYGSPDFCFANRKPGLRFGAVFEPLSMRAQVARVEESGGVIAIAGDFYMPGEIRGHMLARYGGSFYKATERVPPMDQSSRGADPGSRGFELRIPFTANGEIEFFVEVEGEAYIKADIDYAPSSRMRDKEGSFVLGEKTIIHRLDGNKWEAEDFSWNLLQYRLKAYTDANFSCQCFESDRALLENYIRIYPFMRARSISLFMDPAEKAVQSVGATDTGDLEAAYDPHARGADPERYFVIADGDSTAAERLKPYGKTVVFGTDEHKLLHLFAERFVFSDYGCLEPFGEAADLFQGLVRGRACCSRDRVYEEFL